MFCSKCGAEVKEGHKFCMSCGAPVVAPKTPEMETLAVNEESPKKKSKAATIVLIIVAALIVIAIVLIALKLLGNQNTPVVRNDDDDWASVSDGTQMSEESSTEQADIVLNEQLQAIISEKGDIQGSSFDMCREKKVTGWNGVMGSAILDVSGDGVDDLIVVYAENSAIYADVYTAEGDSAISKGKRIVRLTGFDYVDGCEMLGGVYLKQTSDGWNLVADAYSLAWMFADGTFRQVQAVSCKDHAYESAGDFEYGGSDMMEQDYEEGNDVAAKIGMSGVKYSLNNPYFAEDTDVTLIAAYHTELLPIADTTSVKNGEKCGVFYIDNVDSTDSSAAADLVASYNKARDEVEKARNSAVEEDSDYILPMSSQRELTEDDLADIKDDAWMLKLARNEIFARYGRMFDNEDIQQYFDSKDWYEPKYSAKEFDKKCDSLVSRMELDNADFIKVYEDKLK